MSGTDSVTVVRAALVAWQQGQHLSVAKAREVLIALTDTELAPALAGAALVALNIKGVHASELQGMAEGMRALAKRPKLTRRDVIVDIVGTGGDSAHSFNLSTGAALLLAAAGIGVVKHGNRAVSSRSGSADVLAALSIPVPMDEAVAESCFEHTGFAFLFAPHYHPAMKSIAPVRQALGVRTIFNLLGPLSNPVEPDFCVIGAYSHDIADLMAQALQGLAIQRAFVVHSHNGWDEPTPAAQFTLWDVQATRIITEVRKASDYGLSDCSEVDLKGADANHNARALEAVLNGIDHSAHRDALLLGAALGLEVAGLENDPKQAVSRLQQVIDEGQAQRWLSQLKTQSQTL